MSVVTGTGVEVVNKATPWPCTSPVNSDGLPDTDLRHSPQLFVEGLSKSYPKRGVVLQSIDLQLHSGEAVALIGSNGSGKSTLLRCCLRLDEPDSGKIELVGTNFSSLKGSHLRRYRGRIGMVWQRHNLVPRLSALSNVVHGAQNRIGGLRTWIQGFASHSIRDEAYHCLEQVGLAHLAKHRVDKLSGGESQRVAIARALMQRPEIFMADEPVASLDPKVGEAVMELFVERIREKRVTLLFVSHDLNHALRYAQRIIGLRNGRIELDAQVKDLDKVALRKLYG
jgi:phosphonate transport system ATP-binding protein